MASGPALAEYKRYNRTGRRSKGEHRLLCTRISKALPIPASLPPLQASAFAAHQDMAWVPPGGLAGGSDP